MSLINGARRSEPSCAAVGMIIVSFRSRTRASLILYTTGRKEWTVVWTLGRAQSVYPWLVEVRFCYLECPRRWWTYIWRREILYGSHTLLDTQRSWMDGWIQRDGMGLVSESLNLFSKMAVNLEKKSDYRCVNVVDNCCIILIDSR